MLLQGWKHLSKIRFPPHCSYSLVSWSWLSLIGHLANGSLSPPVSRLSVLLEDFRAQLPGFLVPGLLIFCNSDLSCRTTPRVTSWILSLLGNEPMINELIKLKNKTKQKFPLHTTSYSSSPHSAAVSLRFIAFISTPPSVPVCMSFHIQFRFFGSVILQLTVPTAASLSAGLPRVSLCLSTLFKPVAHSSHLANFNRSLHTLVSWFSSYFSEQFHFWGSP